MANVRVRPVLTRAGPDSSEAGSFYSPRTLRQSKIRPDQGGLTVSDSSNIDDELFEVLGSTSYRTLNALGCLGQLVMVMLPTLALIGLLMLLGQFVRGL